MRTICSGVTIDGQYVTCGKVIEKPATKCPEHAALWEATRRPSPAKRGYDRQYRKDRAEVLRPDEAGDPPTCELRLPGCTYWADTADHVDPVSLGGAGGRLVPACKHCNSARGNRAYFPGQLPGQPPREPREPRGGDSAPSPLVIMPDGSSR